MLLCFIDWRCKPLQTFVVAATLCTNAADVENITLKWLQDNAGLHLISCFIIFWGWLTVKGQLPQIWRFIPSLSTGGACRGVWISRHPHVYKPQCKILLTYSQAFDFSKNTLQLCKVGPCCCSGRRKPWLTPKHQPAFHFHPVVELSLELVAALFTHWTQEVVYGLCPPPPPYWQMTQRLKTLPFMGDDWLNERRVWSRLMKLGAFSKVKMIFFPWMLTCLYVVALRREGEGGVSVGERIVNQAGRVPYGDLRMVQSICGSVRGSRTRVSAVIHLPAVGGYTPLFYRLTYVSCPGLWGRITASFQIFALYFTSRYPQLYSLCLRAVIAYVLCMRRLLRTEVVLMAHLKSLLLLLLLLCPRSPVTSNLPSRVSSAMT